MERQVFELRKKCVSQTSSLSRTIVTEQRLTEMKMSSARLSAGSLIPAELWHPVSSLLRYMYNVVSISVATTGLQNQSDFSSLCICAYHRLLGIGQPDLNGIHFALFERIIARLTPRLWEGVHQLRTLDIVPSVLSVSNQPCMQSFPHYDRACR